MPAPRPSTVPSAHVAPCECGYDLAGLPMTGGLTTCPECGRACRPCLATYGPSWLFRSMAFWPWLGIVFACRASTGYMPVSSEAAPLYPLAVGAATCIAAYFIASKNELGVMILIWIMLNAILASFMFEMFLPRLSYAN